MIVEDGTGVTGANSYGAVLDADAYFDDRGNGAWDALSNLAKEQSLVKATDYIEQRFGGRFIGEMTESDQALAWPRTNASEFADDEIPLKLKYACYEYAYRASQAPLAPDLVIDDSGFQKTVTDEKVGPIEIQYETVGSRLYGPKIYLLRPYPGADMYLRGLVLPTSGVIR